MNSNQNLTNTRISSLTAIETSPGQPSLREILSENLIRSQISDRKQAEITISDAARNAETTQASLEDELTRLTKSYADIASTNEYWLSWAGPIGTIVFLPSDVLLALAVVACGGIGAAVSGLRGGARSRSNERKQVGESFGALRDLFLGLSAGFIAFLVIKGGKFLFIIQGAEMSVPINPYGSAFVGILAGLFTERAYQVLSSLVQQAAERFERTTSVEPVKRSRPRPKRATKTSPDKEDQNPTEAPSSKSETRGPTVVGG